MSVNEDGILKDVELKLFSELMKNSRRSDRELAKVIGVSQPTVTRTGKGWRRKVTSDSIPSYPIWVSWDTR